MIANDSEVPGRRCERRKRPGRETHIDTSDYHGPYTVNEVIRDALHPYPADLHIVTKVGNRRAPDQSWPIALSRDELIQAVHDNLDHLGLEAMDVVSLRVVA